MNAHALLAPSSAFRWVNCPLSASLEAAYPETEPSPASLEGTAAHWVVEMQLRGTPVALGDIAPNGVEVTRDMLEGAELVQTDIADKLGRNWRDVLFIEKQVQIPRVHPTDNWGTPDYFGWTPHVSASTSEPDVLHVWDYKFGHGIVEAFENWQLLDYAIGILGDAYLPETVLELIVIQPRAYHRDGPVRRWRIRAGDIGPYFLRLRESASLATGPNPPALVTTEGCENCRGRHACEALQRAAYRAADKAEQFGAFDLSGHALGLELRELRRAQDVLKARVSGLEEEAAARIKKGGRVAFWMMESTPGRLAWTKPVEEVLVLGQMLGLDLAKEPDAITPTQALAAAKAAKLPAELFDAYTVRPSGAVKLSPDNGDLARLTFSSSNT